MIKSIEITDCAMCPFCNHDIEYGNDECNLYSSINEDFIDEANDPFYELPSDTVHERCPLRENQYGFYLSDQVLDKSK